MPAAASFTQSVSFDWRLWEHDILGSMAHAAMLKKIGVLTASEARAIEKALTAIAREIVAGKFHWREELEDVHMNIEDALTRREPAGAKLHTGRSRNDQIALDMRLVAARGNHGLVLLPSAICRRRWSSWARNTPDVVIPGYTHLQRAQPVYLAHHLLAYVEMLERDQRPVARLLSPRQRLPAGQRRAGRLDPAAGPRDGGATARLCPGLTQNSMDAVSDRDFVVEFCAAAALLAVHLSRLAEDLILWATTEFHFITLADAFTTGSSLMPQKKNPDIAELTRGKAGRVIGNLMSLLALLKGLPMTYNRDLQEDKERLFDTADTVRACVRLMAAMLKNTTVNHAACVAAAGDPALLATDLAD